MKGLVTGAIAALFVATAADLAVAKQNGNGRARAHGQQQPKVRAQKPGSRQAQRQAPARRTPARAEAQPRRQSAKAHTGSGPARVHSAPQRSTSVQPTRATRTFSSGCAGHRDPRDAGSCQERGRGNSGDIDPYRGPDAAGNDPQRGNDCDEGGGNNRGRHPRRTNPHSPGDSDVDNDRGRGNNRCGEAGGASSTRERGEPGPRARIFVLGTETRSQRPARAQRQTEAEEKFAREQAENQKDQGGVLGARDFFVPITRALPTTGAGLLGLFLSGLLLASLGHALRRRLGTSP